MPIVDIDIASNLEVGTLDVHLGMLAPDLTCGICKSPLPNTSENWDISPVHREGCHYDLCPACLGEEQARAIDNSGRMPDIPVEGKARTQKGSTKQETPPSCRKASRRSSTGSMSSRQLQQGDR